MSTRLKAAIVVLADTETHEGMGRVANALEAVKEFKEHGTMSGTRWGGCEMGSCFVHPDTSCMACKK